MLKRIRSKLTYANVMSTVAIFMVLTGIGFAVAKSLPKKSVGKNQLRRGAVTNRKIAKNAVTAPKIAANAVGRSEIAAGAVGTGEISNKAVTRGKIADDVAPLLGTLRTGQTLRGSFDIGSLGGAVENSIGGVSYQFPLNNAPSAPQANILDVQANPSANTASCPGVSGGNQQTPNAAAGQLCIYINGKTNLDGTTPLTISSSSRLGFGLKATSAGAGSYEATGFWAVTAP
jgi:hypothetical protein